MGGHPPFPPWLHCDADPARHTDPSVLHWTLARRPRSAEPAQAPATSGQQEASVHSRGTQNRKRPALPHSRPEPQVSRGACSRPVHRRVGGPGDQLGSVGAPNGTRSHELSGEAACLLVPHTPVPPCLTRVAPFSVSGPWVLALVSSGLRRGGTHGSTRRQPPCRPGPQSVCAGLCRSPGCSPQEGRGIPGRPGPREKPIQGNFRWHRSHSAHRSSPPR